MITVGHFKIVCLVTSPLNENEIGGSLALTSMLLPFECQLVKIRTTCVTAKYFVALYFLSSLKNILCFSRMTLLLWLILQLRF